jgi:hypothetical protein
MLTHPQFKNNKVTGTSKIWTFDLEGKGHL